MKQYHAIAVGTGSAVYVVDGIMQRNPEIRAAVIDKDDLGSTLSVRPVYFLIDSSAFIAIS